MPLLAFTPRLENKEKAGMDQWKGCPHHSFLGWYLGPPLDDAFSSSKPHRFSLLFSISLLFLLVRVALKLRSLRFHSPRVFRIAIFSIQPIVSPPFPRNHFPTDRFGDRT